MAATAFRASFPLGIAALLLGGCAAQGDFPSLAPRAVESINYDEEPVREVPAVAPDPALAAQIAALLEQARQGQSAFEAALPAARASVGSAGAAASESWIAAQMAISRLESARGPTALALAELDQLALAHANRPINEGDFERLMAVVESVRAFAVAQKAEIERLRAALSAL